MSIPASSSTVVLFHRGVLEHSSAIVDTCAMAEQPAAVVVFTVETPFHPVDHRWPDQPGDTGTITIDGHTLRVRDSVTAVVAAAGGDYHVGAAIPAKRGDTGYRWLVGHVVDTDLSMVTAFTGAPAVLAVDAVQRRELCAGHTASHLFSLAFNLHAREFWTGPPSRVDSLGNGNIDQLAIESSRIVSFGGIDHYRFGKTVSKQGFNAAAFLDGLEPLTARVNATIRAWVQSSNAIVMEADGDSLDARREWVCVLPQGTARMACGGTHLSNTNELAAVDVSIERVVGAPEIIVHTRATTT